MKKQRLAIILLGTGAFLLGQGPQHVPYIQVPESSISSITLMANGTTADGQNLMNLNNDWQVRSAVLIPVTYSSQYKDLHFGSTGAWILSPASGAIVASLTINGNSYGNVNINPVDGTTQFILEKVYAPLN